MHISKRKKNGRLKINVPFFLTPFLAFVFSGSAINTAVAFERIVSTAGNYSEIIAALGKENTLVGVDTTSILPPEVMTDIPKIGYRRALSAEGILSLNPDVVLLAPDSGPDAVITQLKNAGVNMLYLEDDKTAEGVKANIDILASQVYAKPEAEELIAEINDKQSQLKTLIAGYPKMPKIAFLMDMNNKLIALGDESAGNQMIKTLGGENVFASRFKNNKPVSQEALLASGADIYFLASRNPMSDGQTVSISHNNLLSDTLTNSISEQCVLQVDIMKSLGWGPSFIDAALALAEKVNECL